MAQWKHTRRWGLALLATLLLGGVTAGLMAQGVMYSPPPFETPHPNGYRGYQGPSPLLKPDALLRWTKKPHSAPRQETVLANHVFSVPHEPGRVLAGNDQDFLVYPPDVSGQCDHRGPSVPWTADRTELVSMASDDWRPRLRLKVRWLGCGPPHIETAPEPSLAKVVPYDPHFPLCFGRCWDVLCPANVLALLRERLGDDPISAPPPPRWICCGCSRDHRDAAALVVELLDSEPPKPRVEYLFTGEVGPGRKLAGTPPAVETTPAAEDDQLIVDEPYLRFLTRTLDDFWAEQARLERGSAEAYWQIGFTR